jgi:hypothetical protein
MRKFLLLSMMVSVLVATYAMPAYSAELKYKKPSAGTKNILSLDEIHWCKRESIRIDAMRNVVNTKPARDAHNASVDEYNSRCLKYKYRNDDDAKAQKNIEPKRKQIAAEAVKDAQKLNEQKASSSSSKKSKR